MDKIGQMQKKSLWELISRTSILVLVIINLFSASCNAQETNSLEDKRDGYVEIPIFAIKDSSICKVLDYVIENERKESKYYSSIVSFSIGIIFDQKSNYNVIRIEGTDLERMFLESDELTGVFVYQNHDFFVMEHTNNYFDICGETKKMEIRKDQEITNDDRFEIYFFGNENGRFFQFLTD